MALANEATALGGDDLAKSENEDISTICERHERSYNYFPREDCEKVVKASRRDNAGFAIVATTTADRSEFALNWYQSLRRAGVSNWILICAKAAGDGAGFGGKDISKACADNAMEGVSEDHFAVANVGKHLPTGSSKYGGKRWKTFVKKFTPYVVRSIVQMGISMVYSDTDLAFLKSPVPSVHKFLHAAGPGKNGGVHGVEVAAQSDGRVEKDNPRECGQLYTWSKN